MNTFPQLPLLKFLSSTYIDEFRSRVLNLRDEIIRLRHMEHNTTGEMKEHYKYVIADHAWRLSQLIGEFWRESACEIGALEIQ